MMRRLHGPHRLPPRQRGFGLVEMLVSIAIGLFLLLAVGVSFSSTKGTYLAQSRLAGLQDQERLVLSVLTTTIENEGYYPNPLTSTSASALPASADGHFAAGQGLWGSVSGGNDTLVTRYQSAGGDGLTDCLGGTYAAQTLIVNTYTLSAAGELQCAVNGGNAVTLATGVASLTVRYGLDGSGSGNVDRYRAASELTAAQWPQVKVARISVAFTNPLASQTGQPATVGWTQYVRLMNES